VSLRRFFPLLALAALVLAAGCGEQTVGDQGGARLRVTRDFGHRLVAQGSVATLGSNPTALRLLRAGARGVTTGAGGQVVAVAGTRAPAGWTWTPYVNGVATTQGPKTKLHGGDVVQWDLHPRAVATKVKAIVGSFPEPFVHGMEGKRFPVRVECEDRNSDPCVRVKERLGREGVVATDAVLGSQGTRNVARVVVVPWSRARELPSVGVIGQGPARSGVFARFSGNRLELLDATGAVVRTAGPDSGLVAALRLNEESLTWVVTGGSAAGLERAARGFDNAPLRDAFATAFVPGAGPLALPR
jgi:hypothetical protein